MVIMFLAPSARWEPAMMARGQGFDGFDALESEGRVAWRR
jgi:hypothetical protein